MAKKKKKEKVPKIVREMLEMSYEDIEKNSSKFRRQSIWYSIKGIVLFIIVIVGFILMSKF